MSAMHEGKIPRIENNAHTSDIRFSVEEHGVLYNCHQKGHSLIAVVCSRGRIFSNGHVRQLPASLSMIIEEINVLPERRE